MSLIGKCIPLYKKEGLIESSSPLYTYWGTLCNSTTNFLFFITMGAFKNITSKYLMNQMDFNKQNITIFFRHMTKILWWLFKNTRWLALCFWPKGKWIQPFTGWFYLPESPSGTSLACINENYFVGFFQREFLKQRKRLMKERESSLIFWKIKWIQIYR